MILGEDFAFVANPKTGSRSAREVLPGKPWGRHAHNYYIPEKRPRVVGVVRNPFDRVVSGWRGYCESREEMPLDHYLEMRFDEFLGVPFQVWPQSAHWLKPCNVVLRFERLAEDFFGAFGLELPHEGATRRGPFKDHYTAETRQVVEDRFAADFARWGYSWS